MRHNRLISFCIVITMISNSFSSSVLAVENKSREETDFLPQNKISLDLSEKIANDSDSSFPVVIWLNEENNSTVEEMIYDSIGYDVNSLDESYSSPSSDLIEALASANKDYPDEYLDLLMKNHMNLTEEARTKEKTQTDLYRSTRRNVIKDLNSKRIDSFFDTYPYLKDKTGFASSFSPMIVCNLSVEEIIELAECENVNSLMYYEPLKIEECTIDLGTTTSTVGVSKIRNLLSLNGDGVKIGIYETSCVNPQFAPDFGLTVSEITNIGQNYYTGSNHSTYCAGIAAGNDGVAPGAVIYTATNAHDYQCFDWNNYSNSQLSDLESLIDSGVDLISISWGTQNNSDCYNYWSKYMDSLISNTSTTIICATGNDYSSFILNPSSSYNCISVNGFIDNYNGIQQNVLNDYSFKHGSGCYKPDVIGPSLNNGTSTAAPYIAGMLALMYQYKPSLAASPELTKSILLASCHEKCTKRLSDSTLVNINEAMGLTNRQGAGIPNIYTMISIISQHTYGTGKLSNINNYENVINFTQPLYNSESISVSMSYIQTNVPSNSTAGIIDNVDLSITNNGETNISNKSNSSSEIIYNSLSSDDYYSMRIYRLSGESSEIRYAYAWSTNKEKYYNNYCDEGVFYLKNYKSSLYLSRISNNKIQQKAFNSGLNSIWTLDYNNGSYSLNNANLSSEGIGFGTSINSTNYYAVEGSNALVSNIYVDYDNSTGTYSIKRIVNGATYALGIYQQSTSLNAYAIWLPYSQNNLSQKWYLESLNYRSGDINLDGVINSNDHSLCLQLITHSVSANNLQRFLADVNKDNIISTSDTVAIGHIISEN